MYSIYISDVATLLAENALKINAVEPYIDVSTSTASIFLYRRADDTCFVFTLFKSDTNEGALATVVTSCLNAFKYVAVYVHELPVGGPKRLKRLVKSFVTVPTFGANAFLKSVSAQLISAS